MVVDHLLEELQKDEGEEGKCVYPPSGFDELMFIFTSTNSLAHHTLVSLLSLCVCVFVRACVYVCP